MQGTCCGMVRGVRRENGKWYGTAPYNQWSGYPPLEPSGKELGHVLAMCRRVACAEWVDMCKGHCGMVHGARRESEKWCGTAPYNQWSEYPPFKPSGKLGRVFADVPTGGLR